MLVIDDEQIVLDSVKKILVQENYEVEISLNGSQGLEMAERDEVDVVLTDIRMPDIGGMIVLREIKRVKPFLPVVIITGYASVQSAVQVMKLGAADYLEKPFKPEDLIRVVAFALNRSSLKDAEEYAVTHRAELLKVLDRAASDKNFVTDLLHHWADALDAYDLTSAERLALLTGDVEGIEECTGPLTPNQRNWLEQPLSAEFLRSFIW